MGAMLMNNPEELNQPVFNHDETIPCVSCDGHMIRAYKDLPFAYKGVTLTMRQFPYWDCVNCDEELYSAGKLYKCTGTAQAHFDATGEVVYTCE